MRAIGGLVGPVGVLAPVVVVARAPRGSVRRLPDPGAAVGAGQDWQPVRLVRLAGDRVRGRRAAAPRCWNGWTPVPSRRSPTLRAAQADLPPCAEGGPAPACSDPDPRV